MPNDTRDQRGIKPAIPTITFRCYPDTTTLFLPTRRLMTIETNRLREAYGTKPNIMRNNRLGYTMIPVQCPQPDVLFELNDLQSKYGGTLSRTDFAFEAEPSPDMSVEDQMRWIKGHLIMKRRPEGPILEIKNNGDPEQNGFYFIPQAHKENSPRDVCGYGDRPSKLDPFIRPARFELRLRGREALGVPYRDRTGRYFAMETPIDIIQCDPEELFKRNFKFVLLDMQKFERKLFRDAAKGKTEDEARRAISHLKRSWNEREHQFQYAQRIHDWYPRYEMIEDYSLVKLPNRLTWGAVRRSSQSSQYQSFTKETCNSSSLKHAVRNDFQRQTRERLHIETG